MIILKCIFVEYLIVSGNLWFVLLLMATEGTFSFSVTSVVEDVLQQHATRLGDIDLASRKAEEASLRRYEAAGWLRKMVGVVGGKDLAAEPSEEEFRLGLRSGIILCNVLNKLQPGAVPKVVEGPCDAVVIPDGAALSAYQYFENVRNFLVALEEMGFPTFEASDLAQGGNSARIVNCVLALKSYSEWKQGGGNGLWKFGGNLKSATSGKYFVRKTSEPFMNSFTRTASMSEKTLDDGLPSEPYSNGDLGLDLNEMSTSRSVNMLRAVLSDKKPEEVSTIVESMLSQVMEEFERRLSSQNELAKTTTQDMAAFSSNKSLTQSASCEVKIIEEDCCNQKYVYDEGSKDQLVKQKTLVEQQRRDIQELKTTLHATKAGMQFMQMKCLEEFNNLGKHLHGLAHAASGYKRVLDENRKLYNQVQDLKGNIRVYCRVRPFLAGQSNRLSTVDHIEEGNLTIIIPSKYGKEGRRSFNFNKVFGPFASQEEVFSDTQPLVRSVLDGYNVCIFAYGQTGSGKTYTMTGPEELKQENLGVNYRALGDLFLLAEQRKETFCYDVSVQMIEIYNEQVRDLLATDGLNKRLEIRNSSQKGINVPDANLLPVSSTSDVIYLMNVGQRNRAVGSTALNDRSSRSHSCLTVHVQGRDLTSGTVLRGCMHLVDLAGSERVNKSEVTGDRLKEAQHINKSLSALGDVIASLAQKNSHVPYRNSKLTQLLQDSLGGQAKTLMFVHISPEPEALGETLSTLKFAERVATVELGAARVNKDSTDVKDLKEQIASLKAALARKEESMLIGSSPSNRGSKDVPSGCRQLIEDVGNIEVQNKSNLMLRKQRSDLEELLMNSPPWPPADSTGPNHPKEDEREMGLGSWVDKVMVKHYTENKQLPQMFYQRYLPDPSKIYPEQPDNSSAADKKDNFDDDVVHRTHYNDDFDDLEAATSDSSELDFHWQFNSPKVTSIPNGLGTLKKSQPKSAKSSEFRSLIPTLSPSPARKNANGVSPPSHRNGRQPPSVDGKRKNANVK